MLGFVRSDVLHLFLGLICAVTIKFVGNNRSINSLLQEGARLVRNKYVEQVAQDRKTRTTLQSRYEMSK